MIYMNLKTCKGSLYGFSNFIIKPIFAGKSKVMPIFKYLQSKHLPQNLTNNLEINLIQQRVPKGSIKAIPCTSLAYSITKLHHCRRRFKMLFREIQDTLYGSTWRVSGLVDFIFGKLKWAVLCFPL